MLRRLLLLGFRLLYNEFAWTYDLVSFSVSVGQWRAWQRQVLARIRGDRVLEVAHGTGNLQIDLAGAGYRPVAFDLSPYMGRIAKRKLARRGLSPPFVRGKVQALPFVTGHFTTLVSTFPTEFIVDPETVREFHRVLGPGGRIVFVPAATILPAHLVDRLARWLFEVTGQSVAPQPDGSGWPPKLVQSYRSAGFEVKVESIALPRSLVWVVVAEKAA
jgi:ubiquinone/menaquinone biosynthesis C-methylase UbiE